MRTIRVTGRGQLRLRPDTTRITLTLGGCFPEYDETLRRSSEDTKALQEVLSAFGFGREDLKTLDFGVDAATTRAAGTVLGTVQSIDYSWGEIDLEVSPMVGGILTDCATPAAARRYDLDIEPDDVTLADTVTVVWELE